MGVRTKCGYRENDRASYEIHHVKKKLAKRVVRDAEVRADES